MDEVHALVEPFAEARRDLEAETRSPDRRPVYTSDNEKERRTLQQNIMRARTEVAELEKQVEMRQGASQSEDALKNMLDQLLHMADSSFIKSREGSTPKRQKNETDTWTARAKKHIDTLGAVSGLHIQVADIEPCVLSGNVPGWRYRLKGDCFGIEFTLSFDAEATGANPAVKTLDIDVPPTARSEMEGFLKSVKSDCALHTFFRGFNRYARACTRRASTFRKVGSLYSNKVNTTENMRVLVCHGGGKGLPFNIVWRLSVNSDAQLDETVELLPTPPLEMMENGTVADVARDLPDRFKSLVELRGVEGATKIVICAAFRLKK